MALGADRVSVLAMVPKQGVKMSTIGIAIGVVLSVLFSRALTAGLELPPFNVPTLVTVPLLLLAAMILGALIPARRASRLDPATVVKQE